MLWRAWLERRQALSSRPDSASPWHSQTFILCSLPVCGQIDSRSRLTVLPGLKVYRDDGLPDQVVARRLAEPGGGAISDTFVEHARRRARISMVIVLV